MEPLDLSIGNFMHEFVVSMKLDIDMTVLFDVQLSFLSQEIDDRWNHG